LTLLTRLVVAASLVVAVFAPAQSLGAQKPQPGDQVADFAFTDFGGKQHRLSDYSDRYVLLDFWATWCGPCVKEVPTLRRAEELFQERGLEILGLNSDEKFEKAQEFLEKHHVSWAQSEPRSTKQIIDGELKVKWYPTMILLDPLRRIVFVSGNGKSVLKGKKLLKKLDEVLPSAGPLDCGPQQPVAGDRSG
jgi:thiol-disulfide isomerase/thioredoxin